MGLRPGNLIARQNFNLPDLFLHLRWELYQLEANAFREAPFELVAEELVEFHIRENKQAHRSRYEGEEVQFSNRVLDLAVRQSAGRFDQSKR